MQELLLYFFIILAAAILQTSTGFGFSIMATPFLLLLFLPQEAMQINIILSLVISLSLIWKVRQDIDVALLKKVMIGSVVGAPFGSLLFAFVNVTTFKLLIAILLIGLTILLMKNLSIQQTSGRDYGVGFISGMLTTSIGMAGPPLLLYFASTHRNKETIRAVSIAYYIFIYLISLLSQVTFEGTSKMVWLYSMYALPIVFIGLILGQILFNRLNQKLFRSLIYLLLVAAGLILLIQSIGTML
ncbi:sulfite exporter TauE/SafE family protein [Lysinibacillus macroides]|uniref:Probable membrane transporter protein n=1 Tax=Lysinibacillus macroides TaxID=33935 RepID=A0A0M9DL04_9BACI|nr:sulfite exporter TauE/SafE family protein [Lysinibacillus macroides]KOY83039.1 membrane protein [Lysinibacillus macroides]QPR70108.1 sulfite exporter TauE/SafE family protein [Lysinibacillus macroides]